MGMEIQGARGNTRHRETKSDIMPPLRKARPRAIHIQLGRGVGTQEASWAVPVPGAMADQGTPWAMADQGTLWVMTD